MFTIDLLKGHGIPIRSRPTHLVIVAITFAVPIIIAIAMLGLYLHNSIVASIKKQRIVNYERKLDQLSGAVELQKSFEKEKKAISTCLSEVSTSISRHVQWSPILQTLVENMPESVVLTNLEVKQRSAKRKVASQDDPNEKIDVPVPARTLQMNVAASTQSKCDEAIRNFRDFLRSSTLLGPKLENIRVSQGFDVLGDQDVVSYQIDCVFKPQM